jgi:hypothetical protein
MYVNPCLTMTYNIVKKKALYLALQSTNSGLDRRRYHFELFMHKPDFFRLSDFFRLFITVLVAICYKNSKIIKPVGSPTIDD